jgi:hypothetical protein
MSTRKSKKKSFIETFTLNYILFDSQFMVSDAARAIVNLIKKAFPNCQCVGFI